MLVRVVAFAGAFLASSCVAQPEPVSILLPDPQAEAVLAAVDRFLLAIGNRDAEALKAIMLIESTTYAQRGLGMPVSQIPNAALAAPTAGSDPFIERYWSPRVSMRGDFAQVWAPYELRDNGQRVHCGVNALQLVRQNGSWRVAHILSSMEPEGCDDLQPESAADMRPRDGWRETPLQ